MRIEHEVIQKIEDLFGHMQLVSRGSVQQYNPEDEYRQRVVIGKIYRNDLSADMVYYHVAKLTPWHNRIFEKRKKEILYRPFLEHYPEHGVYRIGFSSYPE